MKLETRELLFLINLMPGGTGPGAQGFTAQEAICLRQKLEGEVASRKGVEVPPDWREQANAFIASGRLNTIAPSKALRDLEAHKSRIEGNRLAALPAGDMLAELGLD